jgi:DNA-binding MarR family transcriptional regulator
MTPTEYRALAEFRWRLRKFLSFSEATARAHDVEPQQHQVLLALKGLEPGEEPTIQAIADRMCVKHHTAVELVDRLEAKRFVRRTKSDVDRRRILVELTDRGEALLAQLSVLHRDELRDEAPKLVAALLPLTKPSTRNARKSRVPA